MLSAPIVSYLNNTYPEVIKYINQQACTSYMTSNSPRVKRECPRTKAQIAVNMTKRSYIFLLQPSRFYYVLLPVYSLLYVVTIVSVYLQVALGLISKLDNS